MFHFLWTWALPAIMSACLRPLKGSLLEWGQGAARTALCDGTAAWPKQRAEGRGGTIGEMRGEQRFWQKCPGAGKVEAGKRWVWAVRRWWEPCCKGPSEG